MIELYELIGMLVLLMDVNMVEEGMEDKFVFDFEIFQLCLMTFTFFLRYVMNIVKIMIQVVVDSVNDLIHRWRWKRIDSLELMYLILLFQ